MADSIWQSRAMQALRPQYDGGGEQESDGLWKLPNWEEYSESDAGSANVGGVSELSRLDLSICSSSRDVESDSEYGDDSSSFDDSSDGCTRRLKRSPVSIGNSASLSLPKRRSALQQLHLRYAKQRQLEASSTKGGGDPGSSRQRRFVDGGEDSGALDTVDTRRGNESLTQIESHELEEKSPVEPHISYVNTRATAAASPVYADATATASQQVGINKQLQSFRQQLAAMQQTKSSAADNEKSRDLHGMSMQTDADSREDAVVQWLNLLTQKVGMVTAHYGHEATENFRATAEYLRGWSATTHTSTERQPKRAFYQEPTRDKDGLFSSWHVGGALRAHLPQATTNQVLELERAIACLTSAVEKSSRCKLENFERSIRQVQGYHHQKLQRVVDESLEELKQVRGKYKKSQDQLEEELRVATRSVDEWRQKAVEIEHKSTLERETIAFQAATFREKFEHLSVRFEDDIQRIKEQLDMARKEKEEALDAQTGFQVREESLKLEVSNLQQQVKSLQSKREQESKQFEQEKHKWGEAVGQLHRSSDTAIQEIAKENQQLIKTLEEARQRHALELATLENRFKMEAEDKNRYKITLEMVEKLQRKHEAQMEALRAKYEQEVEEQGEAVAKALAEVRESRRPAGTQTEPSTSALAAASDSPRGRDDIDKRSETEVRIQELSRKCRALESLLDKKFEQSSQSGSMSPLCTSCNSSSQSVRSSGNFLSTREPTSSRLSQASSGHRSQKALSSSQRSLEDALFTDVDTTVVDTTMMDMTMRNETWDNSSITSLDTLDQMSPYQVLSRPQSAGRATAAMTSVPSNADVLALVRKLENFAVHSSPNEPEAEQSIYTTPQSRSTRNLKPPPVLSRHHAKGSNTSARRVPTKPTTKPLVLRGSNSSSASSTPKRHDNALDAYTQSRRSLAAASSAQRSRFV